MAPMGSPKKDPQEIIYGEIVCHYCGFTPAELPDNNRCPKCRHHSWERIDLSNYVAKIIETLK